jgi:hypothetical protein
LSLDTNAFFAPDAWVEIIFQSFELRGLCQSQDQAEQVLSGSGAKALRSILADLRAAQCVSEFLMFHDVSLLGEDMAIQLAPSEHLIFGHSHLHPSKSGDCINWDKVYRVRILSIGGQRCMN